MVTPGNSDAIEVLCAEQVSKLDLEIGCVIVNNFKLINQVKMNKTALKCIENLYEVLKDCEMNLENVEQEDLIFLSDYFNISAEETIFITLIFSIELSHETCSLKEIKDYLSIGDFKFLDYRKYIELLVEKGLVEKKYRNQSSRRFAKIDLKLNSKLFQLIIDNGAIPKDLIENVSNDIEWLELVANFIDNELEYIESHEVESEFHRVCNRYHESDLQSYLKKINLSTHHSLILIYTIWHNFLGDGFISIDELLFNMYSNKYKQANALKELRDEKHPLVKKELVETKPGRFVESIEVRISEKFRRKLKTIGIVINGAQEKETTAITHKNIVAKELYFSDKLFEQVAKIEEILKEVNYQKVKTRMKEKGMQAGMTMLFFGAPGTGKTECVMQFAKKFKRNVIHVDISETKSMWYGQSEKLIKRIFSQYKEQYQDHEKAPILLLNEADGILGKRKQGGSSSIDNTENAIQNILLEEMEKFEGILIATTNLAVNLDSAFDRRFLFKVKFEMPTAEQRQKIWQIKLPDYEPEVLGQVASEFELSGGQIQNVVRKLEIDYILNGAYPDATALLNLCNDELALQKKNGGKIGF